MVVVSNAIGSVPYPLTTISFVYNRCYYSVLLGYCLYYFIYHLFNALPDNLDQSFENWYYMHVSETRKLSKRYNVAVDRTILGQYLVMLCQYLWQLCLCQGVYHQLNQ